MPHPIPLASSVGGANDDDSMLEVVVFVEKLRVHSQILSPMDHEAAILKDDNDDDGDDRGGGRESSGKGTSAMLAPLKSRESDHNSPDVPSMLIVSCKIGSVKFRVGGFDTHDVKLRGSAQSRISNASACLLPSLLLLLLSISAFLAAS
mmetsp:Transcript_17231/g.27527  ORF Transcript_17231/g.27527 Transcript_17231/m.27527 type:complete len:149 (-) Transcript_17231:880-1326(-)